MIDRTSNCSRLVDKLVHKGWTIRKESDKDKRIINVSITDTGMLLMNKAIINLEIKFVERMMSIKHQEAKILNFILEKLKRVYLKLRVHPPNRIRFG